MPSIISPSTLVPMAGLMAKKTNKWGNPLTLLRTWGELKDLHLLHNALCMDCSGAAEYFYGAMPGLGVNTLNLRVEDLPDIVSEAIEAYYALEGVILD